MTRISRLIGAGVIGGKAGVSLPSLSSILINTYGATEVWPLVDISSGTTITARSNAARNGVEAGWDLQNAAGPVTGTLAPYSDGLDANHDRGNIDSVSFRAIFTGTVGSAFVFAKVANAGVWTDGLTHHLIKFKADNNNQFYITKSSTNNRIQVYTAIGGAAKIRNIDAVSTTDWFMIGISWKDSANGDSVVAYLNATPQAALTGYGAWAGTPTINVIGADSGVASCIQIWNGWLAYAAVKFGSVWSATDFTNIYAALAGAGPENP